MFLPWRSLSPPWHTVTSHTPTIVALYLPTSCAAASHTRFQAVSSSWNLHRGTRATAAICPWKRGAPVPLQADRGSSARGRKRCWFRRPRAQLSAEWTNDLLMVTNYAFPFHGTRMSSNSYGSKSVALNPYTTTPPLGTCPSLPAPFSL